MNKYVIERELPGAGTLPPETLKAISQKYCAVLNEMGPQIQWVESFVTDDRIYCVYLAATEDLIREHAQRGGFPANRISLVHKMIDPTTAEA
jgi:Protein of unknown function (DUF4242)